MPQTPRIGILTSGGDCPGLNAVIRAVTKSLIRQHACDVVGIADGFLGLIENRMTPLTWDDVSNILTTGGTILGTSNKADPRRYPVGRTPDGQPRYEDVTDRVLRNVRDAGLAGLVCIGGDGTMSGAAHLIASGIPCIGVPKTIDNDLHGTELTFGFLTAVQIATDALDRLHTTASSHHRVMILETMGRNAGWIALYAGMASGADLILIPEIPFHLDAVCDVCRRRSHHGRRFTLIAVGEGAHPVGGQPVVERIVADSPDPRRLGGISQALARHIEETTGLETRAVILGHVQRGGSPCAADRILATQFGHAAAELVANDRWNLMVAMNCGTLTTIPITEVAGRQRRIPHDHPLLAAARAVGTSLGLPE